MKVAYADPVYLGQSRLYPEHPESHVWDNPETHRGLIAYLVREFPDGWAMSLSTPSMRTLLPMCPEDARVAAWVKTFCAFKRGVRPCYAWEPVVFWRGRNPPIVKHPPPLKGDKQTTPKDFTITAAEEWCEPALPQPITLKKGLVGAKPEAFCEWVLDLLGVQAGDEVIDAFPGTGIMGDVAAARTDQLVLGDAA